MDILLIIGIVLIAYIGAALALLYAKEDYQKALVPGTIAWIITFVICFLNVLCYNIELAALVALIIALILGAAVQLIQARMS